ncbi:hypothetical protein DRN69_03895 [Candidatus Pacearchaeota archaeon]|nr:MAG: hypothetical protein DRN69_03895 [Candidatus Pacearchaeota archaeon]
MKEIEQKLKNIMKEIEEKIEDLISTVEEKEKKWKRYWKKGKLADFLFYCDDIESDIEEIREQGRILKFLRDILV